MGWVSHRSWSRAAKGIVRVVERRCGERNLRRPYRLDVSSSKITMDGAIPHCKRPPVQNHPSAAWLGDRRARRQVDDRGGTSGLRNLGPGYVTEARGPPGKPELGQLRGCRARWH